MSDPTPYTELNQTLEQMVSSIQEILGGNFIGTYLQGSFATGGFDQHSDADFIVVTHDELSSEQVAALQVMHEHIYQLNDGWAKHLEGSYFPRTILKDGAQAGGQLWFLDHGSRQLERSDHCNTLVVRWVVREHGVTLAGPPPVDLIDPVPGTALRQEILAVIRTWGRQILTEPERFNNRFYQAFIVLSFCRMLQSVITGTIESKTSGAEWAKARLDPAWKGLIDRTWSGRPDPATSVRTPADPTDFASTLIFVRHIMEIAIKIDAEAKPNMFRARIEDAGGGGAYITIPLDVEAIYGSKRPKIQAEIEGETYRGTLVRMGGPDHLLLVLKSIREKIGKTIGDEVTVLIQEDVLPRQVQLPADLKQALEQAPQAYTAFNLLSFTHQKEYVDWIESARREQTRTERIRKTLSALESPFKKPR